MPMPLIQARDYAEKLVTWLLPVCHRLEIAGSVRRERPVCNDIDIVCIPRLRLPGNDLLGAPDGQPVSLLWEFLVNYLKLSDGKAWIRSSAGVPGFKETDLMPSTVNFLLHLPKVELDVFAANDATFITRWITRTGSVQHNIWIAERAKAMGGRFEAQSGLVLDGVRIEPKTEDEFYAALKLPWIAPRDRELPDLARRFPAP